MTPRRCLTLPILLVVPVLLTSGAGRAEPSSAEVLSTVVEILAQQDSYAAVEYVQALGDPPVVARAYAQVVRDLYWKAKHTAGVVVLGRAGILYCLTRARDLHGRSESQAAAWRGRAKALAYDLGSFTWPGWGEDGVVLTAEQVRAGREAADLDLRLARELGRPAKAMSHAHWLVGAHALSAGDFEGAKASFTEARSLSKEAEDGDGVPMVDGYLAITRILAGEPDAAKDLDAAVAALVARGNEDAKFYAEQIPGVLRALRARSAR